MLRMISLLPILIIIESKYLIRKEDLSFNLANVVKGMLIEDDFFRGELNDMNLYIEINRFSFNILSYCILMFIGMVSFFIQIELQQFVLVEIL